MIEDQGQPAYTPDDNTELPSASPVAVSPSSEPSLGDIEACCVSTIHEHVKFNPMMVCAGCKHIIKCFKDQRSFQNYLTFCKSRRRPVVTGYVIGHYTVAFKSYDTTFGR